MPRRFQFMPEHPNDVSFDRHQAPCRALLNGQNHRQTDIRGGELFPCADLGLSRLDSFFDFVSFDELDKIVRATEKELDHRLYAQIQILFVWFGSTSQRDLLKEVPAQHREKGS